MTMNAKYVSTILIIVLSIWSVVLAGTIFEDNFDNNKAWVKVTGAYTEELKSGKWIVNANAQSIIKHALAANEQVSNFTYSVKLEAQSNNTQPVGIICCYQANMQSYMFSIAAGKQYQIGKWTVSGSNVSYKALKANWFSFINEGPNDLKISKKGNVLSFFVNDVFIDTIIDSDYDKGDIALYIGQNEKAAFDHVLLTDKVTNGSPKTFYSDAFDDGKLNGWNNLRAQGIGMGDIKEENGVLKVSSGDSIVMYYTSGKYQAQACTTIVEYKSGTKSAFYGLAYCVIASGTLKTYYFWINADKSYAIFESGKPFTPVPHQSITGGQDTIIISTDYDFTINGQLVDNSSLSDVGLEFNAISLYIAAGLSVEYDDFSAGVEITPIINPNHKPILSLKPSFMLGGIGIIYDTKGRKIGTFDDINNKNYIKDLSSGSYFIIMKNKENHIIHHAIINAK